MQETNAKMMEDGEVDLMQFVKILWKNKWITLIIVILFLGGSIMYASTLPLLYESESKWLTNQRSDGGGQLSRLASLAGMSVGGGSSENYEMYYDEILKSSLVLDSLIFRKWRTENNDSLTLLQLLKIDTNKIVLDKKYLSKNVIVKNMLYGFLSGKIVFENTGKTLSLKITSKDPVFSYEINKFLLQSLKTYSESEKSSKAKKERLFIEDRYRDFKSDLKSAEAKLKKFRENNMNVNSPNLMLTQQRLIREVEIFNQLVIEFRKQLELAKIEEIKKIPEFKILQEPQIPLGNSKPNKKLIIMIGLALGFVTGCFLSLTIGWWKKYGSTIKYELNK